MISKTIQYKPYLLVLCIELNHGIINFVKNTNIQWRILYKVCTGKYMHCRNCMISMELFNHTNTLQVFFCFQEKSMQAIKCPDKACVEGYITLTDGEQFVPPQSKLIGVTIQPKSYVNMYRNYQYVDSIKILRFTSVVYFSRRENMRHHQKPRVDSATFFPYFLWRED